MQRPSRPLVVVIDPVVYTRSLLVQVLEEEFDAYVVQADTAPELLMIVKEMVPSLIVFEVDRRRGLDAEAIAQIKADPRVCRVPLLCLTASGPAYGCESDELKPCDECVPKPFELDDLIARAARLLQASSPSRDARRRPNGSR